MDTYSAFSKVYDKLMENVPYELWAKAIDCWIEEYGISKPVRDAKDPLESERNLVLDMGCGTGTMTRLLYDMGYDMIGVDISPEMLDVAKEKSEKSDIMYICQDMCELDLYSTVGTVVSSCDSVNYLIEDEEIESCFGGVSKFLYPGGLFIFDFNTVHKYRDVIGDATIAENDDDVSFIWENFFDESCNVNECELTLFIEESDCFDAESTGKSGLYRKEEEAHYQRGFTLEEIRDFLAKAGLELIKAVDEDMLENAGGDEQHALDGDEFANAQRIFVIARKAA